MAEKKTYFELLRDPRWQRKRLEIMQRDGFRCRYCTDEASTLNVHHRIYFSGRKPWEYPTAALLTLCETCHKGDDGAERAYFEEFVSELLEWADGAVLAGLLTGRMRDARQRGALSRLSSRYGHPSWIVLDALFAPLENDDRLEAAIDRRVAWWLEKKAKS